MNTTKRLGVLPEWISLGLFALITIVQPGLASGQTTGPDQGTLVIVGGSDRGFKIFRQFIDLAGGKNAKLVVIPTASSSNPDHQYDADKAARFAREALQMAHVTIVHTHDRDQANTDSFVKPIREADAVWFSGGRQWRIADAYLGTLTEREFKAVLDRGGVIGGSSAGATIQGSFLVRGDTSGNEIMIGDHQYGFGYLKHCAIDQHVIPRNRQLDMIEVLTDPDNKMESTIDRQALLGIGIDEATGIIVRQDELEVVGKEDGVVLIYDPKTWQADVPDGQVFLTLVKGAKYNLKHRIVTKTGTPKPADSSPP